VSQYIWTPDDRIASQMRNLPSPTFAGFYDTEYADRSQPDCRGKLTTDGEGKYGYRAIVPIAYPVPGGVRVCFFYFAAFHENRLFGTSSAQALFN
jgi:hypothetical protein